MVGLAFLFDYTLTSIPLVRAGLALGTVVSTALAADTISISIMEAIDNAAMALMPGAMDAGLDDPLFWGTLAGGFALAFPVAFLANRYLIARGKGCAHTQLALAQPPTKDMRPQVQARDRWIFRGLEYLGRNSDRCQIVVVVEYES